MYLWLMSNSQPWSEALLRGYIRTKTRSWHVHLPKPGDWVLLHSPKKAWPDWFMLPWMIDKKLNIDITKLPKGGIVGIAKTEIVGPTNQIMPEEDKKYFQYGHGPEMSTSCAKPQSICFTDIKRLPFFPCKGSQVPTKKISAEIREYVKHNFKTIFSQSTEEE